MPFTDYPNYMGIVALGLAIFAIIVQFRAKPEEDYRLVRFLAIVVVAALLISFGRHFSLLYGALYKFLPFFGKFRVPAMILILVQGSVAVLGAIGLNSLLQVARNRGEGATKKSGRKGRKVGTAGRSRGRGLLWALVGVGVFALVIALFSGEVSSAYQSLIPKDPRISSSAQLALNETRASLFTRDLWVAILLSLAAIGAILLFLRRALSVSVFAGAIISLTVIDLWVVDYRIFDTREEGALEAPLKEDDLVRFLKADSGLFRIFPLDRLFRDKRWGAHGLYSIGGYHPAKVNIYQKFLERTRFPNGFVQKYYKREGVATVPRALDER